MNIYIARHGETECNRQINHRIALHPENVRKYKKNDVCGCSPLYSNGYNRLQSNTIIGVEA